MRLASAPGTWGIEPPAQLGDPSWPRILDEIAEAQFDGSELGPYGYYPTNLDELAGAFAERGLELPAGFVMESLSDGTLAAILDVTRRTCASVAHGGGTVLVLIDGLAAQRTATAGRSELAPRLDTAAWTRLLDTIEAVNAIAHDWGLSVAFHPHAGTHVEFEDEIDLLMADVDSSVGLCVDTGHASYAGIDPVGLIERYARRIVHMHLKDLDVNILRRSLAAGASFQETVADHVFTPLGDGAIDLAGVSSALHAIDYDGWATFEQDRVLSTIDEALPDARRSLEHARRVGF